MVIFNLVNSGNMVIGLTGIKLIFWARKKLQEIRSQNNFVETVDQHIKMEIEF